MKRYLPILVFLAFAACKNGESVFSKSSKSGRPSPPASAVGKVGETEIKMDYSSPRVRERKIWGALVPYDRIWRTGANEATTLTVSRDLIIEGKTLPRGKYSFFTIPQENQWTIIINKDWDLWGSYDYTEKKDIIRIKVTPYLLKEHKERMAFEITETEILFKWEKIGFRVPFKVASSKP